MRSEKIIRWSLNLKHFLCRALVVIWSVAMGLSTILTVLQVYLAKSEWRMGERFSVLWKNKRYHLYDVVVKALEVAMTEALNVCDNLEAWVEAGMIKMLSVLIYIYIQHRMMRKLPDEEYNIAMRKLYITMRAELIEVGVIFGPSVIKHQKVDVLLSAIIKGVNLVVTEFLKIYTEKLPHLLVSAPARDSSSSTSSSSSPNQARFRYSPQFSPPEYYYYDR